MSTVRKRPRSLSPFNLVACLLSLIFALLILYPLFYIAANAMKDSAKIYDSPPRLLPDQAQELSYTLDYSDLAGLTDEELLPILQQDQVKLFLGSIYEQPKASIFALRFQALRDGRLIYEARAHRALIDLEKDQGAYKGVAINQRMLEKPERVSRAVQKMGYRFMPEGGNLASDRAYHEAGQLGRELSRAMQEKFVLRGKLERIQVKTNNWLLLESFKYYFQLPSFLYADNPLISRYSFLIFIFNTVLVIGWAIVCQVCLCALTAFPLSRLLSRRAANRLLLFFLGTTMIPFVAVMIPQLTMFRHLGLYNNYGALLLPHLLPYGFFVYLYKGFFDHLPESLFEAAKIDGASSFYLFVRICLPLSKPIIAVIALQTFLSNWNDFFWAWMVSERQELWTLNVALYNISKISSVKPNFIMGLSVLTILPVLLLTLVFSRQIKENIASAGIKG